MTSDEQYDPETVYGERTNSWFFTTLFILIVFLLVV